MKRCAIYCRVSTPDQHIETQLYDLRQFAAQRGLEVIAEYTDRGISGTKARRPGLDTLMADARHGRFSVLVTPSLSQLAKSTKHLLQLVTELAKLDIDLISIDENIDTSTPAGKAFCNAVVSIRNCERAFVREHIRCGMKRTKLAGFRLGRRPLDVNHAELVSDRLGGMSLTKVSKQYGVSRASVVRFVREAQQRQDVDLLAIAQRQSEPAHVV